MYCESYRIIIITEDQFTKRKKGRKEEKDRESEREKKPQF